MKKVLTVFLSIVLILAMMPSMAFATDGELYCFYASEVAVDENGYLVSEDELTPRADPSVVVRQEETFYFAIEESGGYRVVSPKLSSSNNSDSVVLRPDGEEAEANKPFFLYISEVGSYELSYTDESNSETYKLTMKCELPDIGCYSANTAETETYLGDEFKWSEDCTSFYIISNIENSTIKSVRFVKEFYKKDGKPDGEKMVDISQDVKITVDGKSNVSQVTVDSNAFTDGKQDLRGEMVVEYVENNNTAAANENSGGVNNSPNVENDDSKEGNNDADNVDFSYSRFGFCIYGPNYNSNPEYPEYDETALYCFSANGLTVDDKGYLASSNDDEQVVFTPIIDPSVVVEREEILYFAVWENGKFRVVSPKLSSSNNSNSVELHPDGDATEANNPFFLCISQVDSYEFSYTDEATGKTYKLTIECELPDDDEDDNNEVIGFYSDEECDVDDMIHYYNVNTSLAPQDNCFYIKSTKGIPTISEITTYYFENTEDDEGIYYAGIFDCNATNATEKYYKYKQDETTNGEIVLEEKEYTPKERSETEKLASPKDFIEVVEEDETKGIWKVQFKAKGNKEYRGHERMTFKIAVGTGNDAVSKMIDIDYGVNLLYDADDFKKIIPSHEYFGYILGEPEGEPWIDENNYWGELGGATSSDSDRCGSELWLAMDTTDGYRIADIKNAINGKSLPYTIQAEYYYDVYDKNNQKIPAVDGEENTLGYFGWIASSDRSAFCARQNVGSNNYSNEAGTFTVGEEGVTAFKELCENKECTATLIGSALVYTIFIPVDEQCKVQIVTEPVSKAGDTVTTAQGKNIEATKQDATSEMQTNLNNYYKPGKEIAGVYELGLKASGVGEATGLKDTVDVIIPVEGSPSDYEIVWFNDETPVPVVTRYIEGAVMFTTGHFSTYALVKNKTNTPSGGGGAAIAPSIEKEDVAAITDSTTSKTTITTTINDTKTETTKDENGNDVSKKTAKVSDDIADELVDQAVANKADTVEINVRSDSGNKVDSGENVELEISKSAIKGISEKTNANLVINTDNGKVVLDSKTLETIAAETEGDTVKIIVNENTKLSEEQKSASDALGDNGHLVELVIVVGNKSLHDFEGGKVTVTMPVPKKLKDKKTSLIYINDNGICELIDHVTQQIGTDSYISFTTTHFSTFAIVESAAAEKIIAQQNQDKANDLIKEAKLKASTAKNSKKNVKITAKADKSMIDELKDMGYTVKYRYYRSTKKASKYTALKTKDTNTYINTKGKKGSRYYYKAQVRVYDSNGELIAKTALKQCSYGTRVWSK